MSEQPPRPEPSLGILRPTDPAGADVRAGDGRIAELERQLSAATEKRDADFTGPPDDAHQRAHEVVKDLLNGGISQPTRDQLGKALSTPVAAPMTTASTPKPFPDRARMSCEGDRRRMGG